MPQVSLNGCFKISLGILALAATTFAQTDPGVRGGAPGAGGQIAGLSGKEGKFFASGQDAFAEVASVLGTITGTERGLGPRFNLDSCAGCHKFPAAGGSSPAINPQVTVAPIGQVTPLQTLGILSPTGPIREVRFVSDGGVHDLFTIMGRSDTPAGCNISQPDFAAHAGELRFRIPTPVFGAGLIEAISDATIAYNEVPNPQKMLLGIAGHANRSGNDGTITRFGWKAQNKSLMIFAGEAYNVEQGITNDVFPDERGEAGIQDPLECRMVPAAQDHTNYDQASLRILGDVVNFSNFMRFLAPPAPVSSYTGVTATSVTNGAIKFNSTGCAACHTPSLPTGNHDTPALANRVASLYSDLLVHHMGALGDGIAQGNAAGDEFRTAPLWGLGQRVFFLHDGRTTDLLDAIMQHASTGSEANTVIGNFSALTPAEKQDILNFLRSL